MGKKNTPIDEICSKTDPNWFKTAQVMASEGASIAQICVAIGIKRNTLYKKAREGEEAETIKDMMDWWQTLSEAWWQKTGQENLTNKDFSFQGFGLYMKNRYNWGEGKQSIDITSQGEKVSLPVISWVGEDRDN